MDLAQWFTCATVSATGADCVVPRTTTSGYEAFGASPAGASAFTCPGLANNNGIGFPPSRSYVPFSVVGNGNPLAEATPLFDNPFP